MHEQARPNLTLPPLPPRPAEGHKGTFGTVIVIGGCPTMPGAPALCATACLRSGTGLVKIASSNHTLQTALTIQPGATGIALDDVNLIDALDEADPDAKAVLAVGPGMGDGHAQWINELLGQSRPIVLDADGLNLLASIDSPPRHERLVLTPHPGEFKRLARAKGLTLDAVDANERPNAAKTLAQTYQAVVVLKGHRTVVSDGQQTYINTTGNPAMATAGSGDVLTGVIASLMGQGLDRYDAACLGVYLHGLAGDLWAEQRGASGMLAMELAHLLPEAFECRRDEQTQT